MTKTKKTTTKKTTAAPKTMKRIFAWRGDFSKTWDYGVYDSMKQFTDNIKEDDVQYNYYIEIEIPTHMEHFTPKCVASVKVGG